MADVQHNAQILSSEDFTKTLESATGPVLVDFYADWCGPCQEAAPIIEKLAAEYKGKAVVAKLNVDDSSEISQAHGVRSIPTVIVYKKVDGKVKELSRQIGLLGEQGYRHMIEKALA
jgi:thioredoxin